MNALSLLTLLALAQSPSFDTRKLEQVIELSGSQRATAEKALRADPKSAGPLLSFAARLSGASVLQDVVQEKLRCPVMMGGFRHEPGPAAAAVALLVSLAGSDEAVRLQLATSGHGLDKLVALISVWDDDDALKKLAGQLEAPAFDESERRVLTALRQCAMMRMRPGSVRGAVLERLAQGATKQGSCDDEKSAVALAAAGPFQVRGWGSSGDTFTYHLEAGGITTEANPTCLLALYPPVHARGDGSEVLLPLIDSHSPLEKDAVALLQRDLEQYPKDARHKALKVLLSRGLLQDRISEFNEFERQNEPGLMRAWLASGDPAAPAHLIAKLSCPFGRDDVPSLVHLKDRKLALAEATRLAMTCPRARGEAIATLLALKDPKWLKYAPLALEDPFSKSDLERALTAAWSPAVKQQLLALPSKETAFLSWREEWIRKADVIAR